MEIIYKQILKNQHSFYIFFDILFIIVLITVLALRFLYQKRYMLNINKPNVYLFEYESQKKYFISAYLFFNKIIILITILLLGFGFASYFNNVKFPYIAGKLFEFIVYYFIYTYVVDYIFLFSIKKIKEYSNLSFIRNTIDNFIFFYLLFFSFLLMYFPYKSRIVLTVNFIVFSLFMAHSLLISLNLLLKHTSIKKYQIILYLCTSKILPILVFIYWLNFI